MDSEEPNADGRRHNAVNEIPDTMALRKKRARRVSFAETTSIHFFDRDDEEYNETPLRQTGKIDDDPASESGSGGLSERNKESEGEDEDEMEMRRTFGSASSNDEDNFFGPVSTNFIRPGRLSDSAASDDNHDVTMDSTSFSMHYHSLARSDSGLDLKTPTGGQLFFEEKTPTNSNSGSSMVVSLGKKPIPKSFVPVTELSGSHSSNDMSLVGGNPNKYDYDKLSPEMDAIFAEGRKNLFCVSVSDDLTSVSPKKKAGTVLSSVDHGDNLINLGDSVREETDLINYNSMLNGDDSAAQNEFGEANSLHGILSGPSPNRFSTFNLGVSVDRDYHKPDSSSCQLSKNESEMSLVPSTSSPVKQQEVLLTDASPSKPWGLVSPLSEQPGSLLKNGNVEHQVSETSIQRSISKLELLVQSTFSSTFSAKIDKSTVKSLDFSNSTYFDNLLEKNHQISRINFVENSVTKEQAASANVGSLSNGMNGELNSPFIEVNRLKLIELKATDDKEKNIQNRKEISGTTGNFSTPAKENKSQIMHAKNLVPGNLTSSSFKDNIPGPESRMVSHDFGSPSANKNLYQSRLQKSLVQFPAGSPSRKEPDNKHPPGIPSPKSIPLSGGLENFSANKGNIELLLRNTQYRTDITMMGRSPKLQKGGNYDPETIAHPVEGRTILTGHGKKKWADAYSKFTEDLKILISGSADELNSKMIDALEDKLAHQQRSKVYEILLQGVKSQNSTVHHDLQLEKIAEANSLLHRLMFEKAKLQLKHVKRDRLLKRLELLKSMMQESQILGTNIVSLPLETCTSNVQVAAAGDRSLSVNLKKGHEVYHEELTSSRQTLEALDRKILNLTRTLHERCKMKAEPSSGDKIALFKDYLMKRASCRSVRLDMQMWVVHSVGSVNGQRNVVLNYLDFIMQSTKIIVGPPSSVRTSFKLNEANITKNLPNMDACIAFAFVFAGETIHKYFGAKTLAHNTQATNSLLGTLLDVIGEVQLAQLEFLNLIQSSFISPSAERLDLELCFFNFNSGRKVILTFDISCLKRGIYPSEVLPMQTASLPADSSSSGAIYDEIRNVVIGIESGYMRILRLCKCVSQVVQASIA